MVDFDAHFTIDAIKIGFKKMLNLTWKMLSLKVVHLPIVPLMCACSLSCFHLDRISY